MAEWICGEKTSPLGYRYIDVVHREELIRCKDCKNLGYTNSHWFCKWLNRCVDEDWFCADGERRKQDG